MSSLQHSTAVVTAAELQQHLPSASLSTPKAIPSQLTRVSKLCLDVLSCHFRTISRSSRPVRRCAGGVMVQLFDHVTHSTTAKVRVCAHARLRHRRIQASAFPTRSPAPCTRLQCCSRQAQRHCGPAAAGCERVRPLFKQPMLHDSSSDNLSTRSRASWLHGSPAPVRSSIRRTLLDSHQEHQRFCLAVSTPSGRACAQRYC